MRFSKISLLALSLALFACQSGYRSTATGESSSVSEASAQINSPTPTPQPTATPLPLPLPLPLPPTPQPTTTPNPTVTPKPSPSVTPTPAPSPTPTALLTAADFSKGTLRGFNSLGDISTQSLSAMAATGANLARVFINLNRTPNTTTYTISSTDLTRADTVIRAGAQYGFKVILVFEPLPNQTAEEFWDNPGLQSSISDNWKIVAAKYKGNTAVAGYDLINEPITKTAWNKGGQSQWMALASGWISDIRSVDPDHVIFFEPSPGGLPMGFSAMTSPLPFANIVYSTHFYQPHEITHQGLYSYSKTIPYPSTATSPIGVTDKSVLSTTLDPVRKFANLNHVPIYVGEFSCARWAPGNSSYLYVADVISLIEAEKFSWTYHSWREYQGWDAEIPSSYFQGLPFVNAMPQGFDTTNTSALRSGSTDTMLLLKQSFLKNSH